MFRARVANPRWIALDDPPRLQGRLRAGGHRRLPLRLRRHRRRRRGLDVRAGRPSATSLDADVREFFARRTRGRCAAIAERLLEAAERGLWAQPDDGDARRAARAPTSRSRASSRRRRRDAPSSRFSASSARRRCVEALLRQRGRPDDRRRARARRARHGEDDRRARRWRRCCRGRGGGGQPLRLRPAGGAPGGTVPADAPSVERARRRSSSCRSARPRTASSARSTSTARWPTAQPPSSPGLLAARPRRRPLRRRGQPAGRPPRRRAARRRRARARARRARGGLAPRTPPASCSSAR